MKTGATVTNAAITRTLAGRCGEQSFKGVTVLVLLLSLATLSGCARFAGGRNDAWKTDPSPARKEGGKSTLTAYGLQLELMRFADDYSSMAGEIADDLARKAKTPEDRVRPLAMKVAQANAVVSIASNPNPFGGAMDMVVLASLTRSSFEDYLVPKVYGEDARRFVERYRKAEDESWRLASRVLDPERLAELKHSIEQWRADNPEQHYVSFVRLRNLYKPGVVKEDGSKKSWTVFSLLLLDPFAGLDPATREIELSRQTAERAMYQFQKLPQLLDWQLSLVLSKTVAMPEIQKLVTAADRFSLATEEFPKHVAEERVALVKDLNANEPKLRDLLAESRKTLEAGGDTADSVKEAVLALNRFVDSCGRRSMPGATNGPVAKPFDVTEYGASATQIACAVREMNELANSVEQKMLPQAGVVIGHAKSAGAELVDHVFWRAVEFVVVTLVGAFVTMLSYRVVATRCLKNRTAATGTDGGS